MIVAGLDSNKMLITGRLVKDAEVKHFGSKNWTKTKLVVSPDKDHDLITVVAKFDLGNYCASFRKGDYVLVCGEIESREYEGRVYTDLVAEFVVKQMLSRSAPAEQTAPAAAPASNSLGSFSDVSMDDCPFV